MRVAMIDPSLFTLPYDRALVDGLTLAGHEVTLFGRRPGPDDNSAGGVTLVNAFYRLSSRRPLAALPSKLRLGVKGLDHFWSMWRLIRVLHRARPDIIHFQWLPLPLVDRQMLARLRRIAPLVLTGPPSVTGFAGGRPQVEEVVAYWPALIDRREIEPGVRVEILDA